MSLLKRGLVAAAVLAAGCSSTVWAAGESAAASLTDVRFVFTDLAPADGIAPSMSVSADNAHSFAGVIYAPEPGNTTSQQHVFDEGPGDLFSPRAASLLGGNAQVTANSLIASFTSAQPGRYSTSASSAASVFNGLDPYGFELSPHTQLEFTAFLTLDANLASGPCPCRSAEASFGLLAEFIEPGGFPRGLGSIRRQVGLDGWPSGTHQHLGEQIRFVFDNDTDAFARYDIELVVNAETGMQLVGGTDSGGPVTPVPEPSSAALLLLGLPLVWRLRRRQS